IARLKSWKGQSGRAVLVIHLYNKHTGKSRLLFPDHPEELAKDVRYWVPIESSTEVVEWKLGVTDKNAVRDWPDLFSNQIKLLMKHTQEGLGDPRGITEPNFPGYVAEILWRLKTHHYGHARKVAMLLKAL